MQKYRYTVLFVLILSATSALILAGMYTGLKDIHEKNAQLFKKRVILKAISPLLDKPVSSLSDDDVEKIFQEKIQQVVLDMEGNPVDAAKVAAAGYKKGDALSVDMAKEFKKPESERLLPLYVYKKGDKKYYITGVMGRGLWDLIWGYIALEEDKNTIAGVAFEHAGETPGLGAEIKDNPSFGQQFVGKKIHDAQGKYHSITVRKGGAKDPNFEVDAISGATLTSDGVTEMLQRSMKYYDPYFQKVK